MGLTKTAAPEHLPKGIRVDDVVNSASSNTPFQDRLWGSVADQALVHQRSTREPSDIRYEIDGSYYSRNRVLTLGEQQL